VEEVIGTGRGRGHPEEATDTGGEGLTGPQRVVDVDLVDEIAEEQEEAIETESVVTATGIGIGIRTAGTDAYPLHVDSAVLPLLGAGVDGDREAVVLVVLEGIGIGRGVGRGVRLGGGGTIEWNVGSSCCVL
jgi:hypothetical protein